MQTTRRRALGAAAGTAALAGLGASRLAFAQDAGQVMKLSTATVNEVQHEWLRRFAAEVAQASGGRIKGEVYPASQLGSIPRQIEGTQFGSIQAWSGPPQFLAGIDSRFELPSAPGVFRDEAHAHRALQDPEFNAAFLALGANKGIRGLGLFVLGSAGFVTRQRAVRLADLEGRKIRVLAAEMDREEMRRLKVNGIPMALGEVLPAIQQGTIDGMMSSIPVVTPMRYYDSAKYYLETGHAMVVSMTVVSRLWFDKLAPDLQKIVLDAGRKVSAEIGPWAIEDYARARAGWIKGGGEVNTLSAAEREQLTRTMAPIGPEVSSRKPEEKAMYELMVKAAERTARG
jgi:C4-dicarboxylate-binding protein DctP